MNFFNYLFLKILKKINMKLATQMMNKHMLVVKCLEYSMKHNKGGAILMKAEASILNGVY